MALLSSITVRAAYLISTSYNSLLESGVGTPLIQVLLIVASLYTIHRLYLQQKLEEEKERDVPTLQNVDNVYSNLAWVNQTLRWFTLTNKHTSLPLHVQRWLDDINANLDIQNNEMSIFVYGFREGTVTPWVKKIEDIQTNENGSMTMKVTVETSDFGFLTDVQEKIHTQLVQSTHSLIITKFEGKFNVELTRKMNNDVSINCTPSTEKHKVTFKMKAHNQHIQSTVPEVVGNHVVDACMATNFQWTIDGSEADDERGSAGSSSLYDSSIVVTSRTAFYDVREKEGDALYHNELKVVDEEGENIETNSYAEKCNSSTSTTSSPTTKVTSSLKSSPAKKSTESDNESYSVDQDNVRYVNASVEESVLNDFKHPVENIKSRIIVCAVEKKSPTKSVNIILPSEEENKVVTNNGVKLNIPNNKIKPPLRSSSSVSNEAGNHLKVQDVRRTQSFHSNYDKQPSVEGEMITLQTQPLTSDDDQTFDLSSCSRYGSEMLSVPEDPHIKKKKKKRMSKLKRMFSIRKKKSSDGESPTKISLVSPSKSVASESSSSKLRNRKSHSSFRSLISLGRKK